MVLTEKKNVLMSAAVNIPLLSVVANTFSIKKGGTQIAALSWMLLVSQVDLKVAKSPMIEMGSLWSKKCAFICELNALTMLNMYLDAASL